MHIKYIFRVKRERQLQLCAHCYINVLLTLVWRHTCIQREVRTENAYAGRGSVSTGQASHRNTVEGKQLVYSPPGQLNASVGLESHPAGLAQR